MFNKLIHCCLINHHLSLKSEASDDFLLSWSLLLYQSVSLRCCLTPRCSLLPFEEYDVFDVVGVGEHVDGLYGLHLVHGVHEL